MEQVTTNCPLCGNSYSCSPEERADRLRRCDECNRQIQRGDRPGMRPITVRCQTSAANEARDYARQLVRVALGCLERGEDASALWRLVDAAGMLQSVLHPEVMGGPSVPTGRGHYVGTKP